jgi:hypothetical protein
MNKKQHQSSGGSDEPAMLWGNPEGELIDQICEIYKEFSLKISDFLYLICMCERTVTLTGHYTVPVLL